MHFVPFAAKVSKIRDNQDSQTHCLAAQRGVSSLGDKRRGHPPVGKVPDRVVQGARIQILEGISCTELPLSRRRDSARRQWSGILESHPDKFTCENTLVPVTLSHTIEGETVCPA